MTGPNYPVDGVREALEKRLREPRVEALRPALEQSSLIRRLREAKSVIDVGLIASRDPAIIEATIARAVRDAAPGTMIIIPELERIVTKHEDGSVTDECMKCMNREIEAETGIVANYTHQWVNPEIQLEWDNKLAWSMIRVRDPLAEPVPLAWLSNWIAERSNLTPGHIDHIPAERVHDPLLIDPWVHATVYRGGPLTRFPILVDGHHRAARLLRDGTGPPPLAFYLTQAEHNAVVTRHDGAYDSELVSWRSVEEARAAPGPKWVDFE